MKENMELERGDIAIGRDMEVDCDIGQEILAYVETWFDVDKKFGVHTADNDGIWLNLYARYNPFADTLAILCAGLVRLSPTARHTLRNFRPCFFELPQRPHALCFPSAWSPWSLFAHCPTNYFRQRF